MIEDCTIFVFTPISTTAYEYSMVALAGIG
jgi:hypothetical protein